MRDKVLRMIRGNRDKRIHIELAVSLATGDKALCIVYRVPSVIPTKAR